MMGSCGKSRIIILLWSCLALLLVEVNGRKNVRFVSPLHTLTIWDGKQQQTPPNDATDDSSTPAAAAATTPRSKFLPKYEVGLQAEIQARKKIAEQRQKQLQIDAAANTASRSGDESWSQKAARFDFRRRQRDNQMIEKAYDTAVANYQREQEDNISLPPKVTKNQNKFQFVGVIQKTLKPAAAPKEDNDEEAVAAANPPVIKWYARKKPSGSKWSVRLVHTDPNAVMTDLFRRGKVDVFAQYDNTGKREEDSNAPIVSRKYTVKERSWRTLWNFSPKHYFTDSSGMYWRERRLQQGLYTDGNTVYESTYRYRDGRNGMHRLSSFQQYLDSPLTGSPKEKQTILQKLDKESPDLVVEE